MSFFLGEQLPLFIAACGFQNYLAGHMRELLRICSALTIVMSSLAMAQRVPDNAIASADDAFGNSVGRESIGLYTANSVRGFSANVAGNARIDGLYFDPVWVPSTRIRQSTAIRVGISAQGFAFPAPTGIVDYTLRRPGAEHFSSLFALADSNGAVWLEVDRNLALANDLSLSGGLALYRNVYPNGTSGHQGTLGLTALWRPSPSLEVQPFWTRSDLREEEFGPLYLPGGAYLPPPIERGRFFGPDWPQYRSVAKFYGAVARYDFAEHWQLRSSLVRTSIDTTNATTHLLLDLTPQGMGRRLLLVDPPSGQESSSAELRATRSFKNGPRLHEVHVNLRGRNRSARYGGADRFDEGSANVGQPAPPVSRSLVFSQQTLDAVKQLTGGLAYDMRWQGIGEVSLGVQRTKYEKQVFQPRLPQTRTQSSPWLYNFSSAAHLNQSLALYVGYTRGLEESGVAPSSATNRNEAMPSILTEQRDAGLRWNLPSGLKLVFGVFDVRKPYFQLDQSNTFALLGDVQHQGLETSLSGRVTEQLTLVAGGVFMRPRVTGQGVDLGRVGARPVGQPKRTLQFNLDWQSASIEGLSLDIGATHLGQRPATRDNSVDLPQRTLVDAGARYRFSRGESNFTFRARMSNVFDKYGLELRGSGVYDIIPERMTNVSMTIDF